MSNDIVLKTGFQEIFATVFRTSTLKKGKKLVSHVFNVEEHHSLNKVVIIGSCLRQASVTKLPYKVELEVDRDRSLVGGYCSCISGEHFLLIIPLQKDF